MYMVLCSIDLFTITMKLFVALVVLAAVAHAREVPVSEYNDAYGYLVKYGIPEAERIRKAEEEYLKSEAESRIVGGSPTPLGQIPYQAGLILELAAGSAVCGGSLISRSRVLTAAHCWFDGQNQVRRVTVVLGSVLLFSGGTRVQSQDVVMHPNWRPSTITNDVAVIRLANAVSLSNTINIVALPTGSQINENFANERGVASGFGLTRDGGSIASNQFLSHVSLNIITNSVCSFSFPLMVQTSNICTSGAGGQSTCRGDSGGPLVVRRNNRDVLAGITSFGSARGCQQGMPAVYARVTSFLSFINQHI